MKFIKKFNEGTVQDYRDDMSHLSKQMHKNNAKEFYLIMDDKTVQKYIIPEEFRGEFEEQYIGDSFIKDTAEFINQYALDCGAVLTIMDYEMDYFMKNLQDSKSDEGYDISQDA